MMWNVIHNERGAAMLIALSLLFMMALMGVSAIQTSSVDMSITDNYKQDARSFYIAEAGLEHACAILRDSSGWRTGLSEINLGGGSYSVRVLDEDSLAGLDDTVLVISTGTRSGAVSMVQVKLATTNPWRWAAFADSSFELGGNTLTDSYDSDSGTYASTRRNEGGDIGSNGHVDIYGTADIYGDASTSSPGEMDITGAAVVTGDTTSLAPEQQFDPVTTSDINAAKAVNAAPAGLSGNYVFNSGTKSLEVKPNKTMTLSGGTYYFSSMDLKGTVNVQSGETVKIYIDGDISMNSQANVNMGGAPKQLQIYSKGGNVTFNGGGNIKALLYAPDSEFSFTGHAELYGSFIMGEASNAGGSGFHYDRSLRNLTGGGELERVAWKEL
jgi:hypothetical protein